MLPAPSGRRATGPSGSHLVSGQTTRRGRPTGPPLAEPWTARRMFGPARPEPTPGRPCRTWGAPRSRRARTGPSGGRAPPPRPRPARRPAEHDRAHEIAIVDHDVRPRRRVERLQVESLTLLVAPEPSRERVHGTERPSRARVPGTRLGSLHSAASYDHARAQDPLVAPGVGYSVRTPSDALGRRSCPLAASRSATAAPRTRLRYAAPSAGGRWGQPWEETHVESSSWPPSSSWRA